MRSLNNVRLFQLLYFSRKNKQYTSSKPPLYTFLKLGLEEKDYENSRKSAIFQDVFIFAGILDSVVGFKYLDRKDHTLILF
jgi:Predicted membrane protein